MKIQYLAVIFIVIIVPISLVISTYTKNEIKTLDLQTTYDTKLTNATYDALKAYQLNAANSDSYDMANSKMRDINASVNTFYNSIATNFNQSGYNRNTLKDYVPALVYTMYDGFYIYSSFYNTLENENYTTGSTYQPGEKVDDLKPYVYYSCRYVNGTIDVVITYSLDNYINIKGMIGNNPVNESGYLLDHVEKVGNTYKYKEYTIPESEEIKQTVYDIGTSKDDLSISTDNGKYTMPITNEIKNYLYRKQNGARYYYDDTHVYTMLNNSRMTNQPLSTVELEKNDSAKLYYKSAYEIKNFITNNGLNNLRVSDAVDESGLHPDNTTSSLKDWAGDNSKIFDFNDLGDKGIEDSTSNFNQHRQQVIRYTIEKNLTVAISNYNSYSNSRSTDFQMPKLKEDEWEKLLNNISIISFMQGLSIGGKVYNGYSIVENNNNSEVVSNGSIYVIGTDENYHKITEENYIESNASTPNWTVDDNSTKGIFSSDTYAKSVVDQEGVTQYFFPIENLGSYNSIITSSNNTNYSTTEDIYKYLKGNNYNKLAKIYYTALGRERYQIHSIYASN